jgi:hypothetical protein
MLYVQRGTINHPIPDDRLSKAVDMDYMGSVEFEFGALPKSLRALETSIDQLSVTVEPRIVDEQGRSLRVLHAFTPEGYEEYVVHLLAMRDGTARLKESTYFDVEHPKRFKTLRADFWWDITNHVMWSFDKAFMKKLPDCLVASWRYMNEK